jgi:uncharacterized protein
MRPRSQMIMRLGCILAAWVSMLAHGALAQTAAPAPASPTKPAAKATAKPTTKPAPPARVETPGKAAPVELDACTRQILAKRKAAIAPTDPATTPAATDNGTGQDAAYLAYDKGQYITALELAQAAAARGDPQAHTLVARIHAEGQGVPRDEILAARWYARAAELCDVPALFSYGVMLAEGRGVGKDRLLAGEMLEKAALSGHALANYNLGLLFLRGDGKPENPIRAAQHILYAAENGIASAQYDMGTLYLTGLGVPNDAVEASRWLGRAAAGGHTPAQYDYAILLLKGLGLNQDMPKAVEHLRAAAEKGIGGAQNRMAHLYLEGVRVDKNGVEAAKWRILAKNGGLVDDALDAELAKLSKADRAAAEQAAVAWTEERSIGLTK